MKSTILLVFFLSLGLVTEYVYADFTFGTPTNLGPNVNSSYHDGEPSISADGLELYFNSSRSGGSGRWDLWVTTRATTEDDWGNPQNLGPTVNSSSYDLASCISADGLSLYFASDRPGGSGYDVWVTTRPTKDSDWEEPVNLGPTINSTFMDAGYISPDGLELYIGSNRPGGSGESDLWVSTRATTEDAWGIPVNLGPTVNAVSDDVFANISSDGLTLFFSESLDPSRSGGYGFADLWVTKRPIKGDPWGTPVNLGSVVNSASDDRAPSISADGSMLYFSSNRPSINNVLDLWQVTIDPVVDLNGDGIVNAADMCIIVNHWSENYPLCDIGPMPWGDGIVDVQDLIVLAGHLFENINDPTLIAHWALDETEGSAANDSVSGEDAFVMGEPVWQTAGGVTGGALELDGIDDCIIAGIGPNPAEGSFSIVAWIKGGAPGQVIFAQPGRSDLLAIDTEGNLMTGLNGLDQSTAPLLSQALVTDDQWHRIGLVWDSLRRTLFVDGITVAEDTEDGQGAYGSGLYIGVGKNYAAGTYFSGLIDDVRIYNRALSP